MDELGVPAEWRDDPNLKMFRAKGCPACSNIGYRGRTGLFELLTVDGTICDMILNRAMAYEIRKYARFKQGMRTLREEALIKAVQGITTPDEVIEHTDLYDDDIDD